MSPKPRAVKAVRAPRAYDVRGRQERARRQYLATLAAASERFLEHGYVATTVESIAAAAGVSPATIYKSYGGKGGLVRALCAQALEGAGPTPAEERSNALRTNADPRAVIDGWGRLVSEVAPRVAPLLLLLRDASRTDAEAAALYDELDHDRVARMTDNAAFLANAGHLADHISAEEARDVLWLTSSPELYELMVIRRGWTVERHSRFVVDMMATLTR
jgi:AcrR family transcriptional regulator